MKKCALCGKGFQPRRAAARYCSVPCRQQAYGQRQREAEPRYRLERALLTAIRELRGGRPAAALMSIRLAVDDYELARQRAAKGASGTGTGRGKAKAKAKAKAAPKRKAPPKLGAPRRGRPPGPPPKRAKRPRSTAKAPGPPPKRTQRAGRAAREAQPPPTKRSPKSAAARARSKVETAARRVAGAGSAVTALMPYSDLHARYEHVLSTGTVTQAAIAKRLGLADGSPLSRWRRGGPLAPERVSALDEVVAQYEWEIFAGETLS